MLNSMMTRRGFLKAMAAVTAGTAYAATALNTPIGAALSQVDDFSQITDAVPLLQAVDSEGLPTFSVLWAHIEQEHDFGAMTSLLPNSRYNLIGAFPENPRYLLHVSAHDKYRYLNKVAYSRCMLHCEFVEPVTGMRMRVPGGDILSLSMEPRLMTLAESSADITTLATIYLKNGIEVLNVSSDKPRWESILPERQEGPCHAWD